MSKNRLNGEFWVIFGGLGLIMAGLFIFLPIWVAINPNLPYIDALIVIVSVLSGFGLLTWGFSRYRWPELKDAVNSFLRERPKG